jgi:hypothetical protein
MSDPLSQTRPNLGDADKLRAQSLIGRVVSGRYRIHELLAMRSTRSRGTRAPPS